MLTSPQTASVTDVNQQTGARFRARRAALRATQEMVAQRAGVDADTVSRAEKGLRVQVAKMGAIDQALTEMEHERGVDLPSQVETVTTRPIGEPEEDLFEVSFGEGESRVVVKGPVSNPAAFYELVERIMRTRKSGDR